MDEAIFIIEIFLHKGDGDSVELVTFGDVSGDCIRSDALHHMLSCSQWAAANFEEYEPGLYSVYPDWYLNDCKIVTRCPHVRNGTDRQNMPRLRVCV